MKANQVHWPSVAQFGLSALVVFNAWGVALSLVMMGISGLISRDSSTYTDPLPLFLMASAAMVSGFMLLPSAYYALWRLLGWHTVDLRATIVRLRPTLWIMALPLVLLLGYWVSSLSKIARLALPFLHVLAVGLPVSWILILSVRGLPLGSPQRMWGVFGSGMALAPALILVVEGIAGLAFLVLSVAYIVGRPGLVEELARLADWMRNADPSPEALIQKIGPFMIKPAVIFSVLAFGAVIVPLIEELLKPIGVWLLAGRKLSPAAGFAAGVLSGAAYALIESLALTSDGQQWVSVMVARIGTTTIHIFTSGLMGWALVQAWRKGRYALLGVSYLAAVSIHGLWNALTLFTTFAVLASMYESQAQIPYIIKLGQVAPFGLTFLAIGAFTALLFANHSLGRSHHLSKVSKSHVNGSGNQEPEESML